MQRFDSIVYNSLCTFSTYAILKYLCSSKYGQSLYFTAFCFLHAFDFNRIFFDLVGYLKKAVFLTNTPIIFGIGSIYEKNVFHLIKFINLTNHFKIRNGFTTFYDTLLAPNFQTVNLSQHSLSRNKFTNKFLNSCHNF